MSREGSLVVISGFSGVGKGTIVSHILKMDEDYVLSVSCTSRQKRDGEVHGREYFFVSREEFESMIGKDELIEYTLYCENYYGTPKSFVMQKLAEGKNVILEIEVNGALNIRRIFPDAVLIYIMPPSAKDLLQRLADRGSENAEVRERRIRRAVDEAEFIEQYDYVFVNENNKAEECAASILNLIEALEHRTCRSSELIDKTKEDISTFLKGE